MNSVAEGFSINWIKMKDYETGTILWEQQNSWDLNSLVEAHVPKSILQCRAVSREINFSSKQAIQKFRLVQKVKLAGELLEEWSFEFGFVIPGSENNWEQVIDAAPPEEMLPAEVLSGNVIIETCFYDENELIHRSYVKVFYD
ncbi:unnamed protein product [Blepharisma stoltei]|uniref:GMP phosphodiesterase delta subunit domain-containing protein n=1 Tax=Blepharisma stoltei TaxID=1481888 RepID=A0AAU9K6Y6_9CILI|nr:unnamed protein product [Blepharisma stoltei]